jgi:excisionase family DNA binding protein
MRSEVVMQEPIFHTVHEAARILRVDATTIYRSDRAGSFPAIRIRSRYVIPAAALREVAAKAVSSGPVWISPTWMLTTSSAADIGRR